MKRFLALFLTLMMLLPAACLAEAATSDDLAHQIWHAMAEVGNIDLTNAWELFGMYTFGETTGGPTGHVTLSLTEDSQRLHGSISWRNYPDTDEDVYGYYFPMLQFLLTTFGAEEEQPDMEAWLQAQQSAVMLARANGQHYRSDDMHFQHFDIYVQYDEKHNELYGLLTVTADTDLLAVKAP